MNTSDDSTLSPLYSLQIASPDNELNSTQSLSIVEDPIFYNMLVDFVKGVPCRLDNIHSNLITGNFDKAIDVSHSLKGSSGLYGFPDMVDVATKIEDAAKSSNMEQTMGALEEAKKLSQRMLAGIKES